MLFVTLFPFETPSHLTQICYENDTMEEVVVCCDWEMRRMGSPESRFFLFSLSRRRWWNSVTLFLFPPNTLSIFLTNVLNIFTAAPQIYSITTKRLLTFKIPSSLPASVVCSMRCTLLSVRALLHIWQSVFLVQSQNENRARSQGLLVLDGAPGASS